MELFKELLDFFKGLTSTEVISIFSAILASPLVVMFVSFLGKKITKSGENIDVGMLEKEKKKIQEELYKIKLKEVEFNNKKNELLKRIKEINDKLNKINSKNKEKYSDISEWLLSSRENVIKFIVNNRLEKDFELTEEEKKALKRQVVQITRRVEHALLNENYLPLSSHELYSRTNLDNKELYINSLKELIKSIPDKDISTESKEEFCKYVQYAIASIENYT